MTRIIFGACVGRIHDKCKSLGWLKATAIRSCWVGWGPLGLPNGHPPPVTPIRPSGHRFLIIVITVSIIKGTVILTRIMVIMVGARQPAESVTPIRAIGATRVVPSFVCSHSPAHLSGKARAGAADRDSKCQLGTWRRRWKLRQGEGGAQARGCNFGARDSSFGPSLKKGTRRWCDVCQDPPPAVKATAPAHATNFAQVLLCPWMDIGCIAMDRWWQQHPRAPPSLPILMRTNPSELKPSPLHQFVFKAVFNVVFDIMM